jgi:hypothetical protein
LFFSASKQKIGKKIGTNLIWGCCEFCGCDWNFETFDLKTKKIETLGWRRKNWRDTCDVVVVVVGGGGLKGKRIWGCYDWRWIWRIIDICIVVWW